MYKQDLALSNQPDCDATNPIQTKLKRSRYYHRYYYYLNVQSNINFSSVSFIFLFLVPLLFVCSRVGESDFYAIFFFFFVEGSFSLKF